MIPKSVAEDLVISQRRVAIGPIKAIAPFKAELLAELVRVVWPKVEAGMMKPSIYKVLPIQEAEEAHAILQRGENVGKVVLTV